MNPLLYTNFPNQFPTPNQGLADGNLSHSPAGIPPASSPKQRRQPLHTQRQGALTVELILTLPIFLIVLVAVVQFGLYYVRMQHVALASRIGAEQAAQTPGLSSYSSVPGGVVSAVTAQLQAAGIDEFCIRLEHNLGSGAVLWEPAGGCPFCGAGGCTCCPSAPLPSSPYPGTNYVRLSICVPLTELMPNGLKVFGFDLTGKTTTFTMVFRYEL